MLDPNVFKAYDVRGIYPDEFDEEGARAIGRAYVEEFEPRRMAVGRDMRLSSPSMAAAEDLWAQGWSEPNAGSDLAGIKSKAVRDDVGGVSRRRVDPRMPAHRDPEARADEERGAEQDERDEQAGLRGRDVVHLMFTGSDGR